MEKVEIPLSKKKLVLGIIGSILFVVLGAFVVMSKEPKLASIFVKIAGIAGILFFGATGVYGVIKSFDKSIGLTIDENGIIDNSSASSIGLIKWSDITEIQTSQVQSTKFLLIHTVNPDFYINKAKGVKRKVMEMNKRFYGTPLSIASTTLKYNFKDLEKLINDKFHKYVK